MLADRIGSHRVRAEPDAVDQIIAACAGLPLVLAIVAARAAGHPDFPSPICWTAAMATDGSMTVDKWHVVVR